MLSFLGGANGSSLQWPVKMGLVVGIPSLAAALAAYLIQLRIRDHQAGLLIIHIYVCILFLFSKLCCCVGTDEDQLNSQSYAYRDSQSTCVEVRVPNNCVRAIIGQQGCVIKEASCLL